MFVDIAVYLGAVVFKVIGRIQQGPFFLLQNGVGELCDDRLPTVRTFHQELDQSTQFPPRTLEQKDIVCFPERICLDLFEDRQLFPNLRDTGFTLQQRSGVAQLFFGILESGHLLDVCQHHAIDEVVKSLGKFVRFRRLNQGRDFLY